MLEVTNKYTIIDNYNSFIIISAVARAMDCSISYEPLDDRLMDVYITCMEHDIPTIESMLATIAVA